MESSTDSGVVPWVFASLQFDSLLDKDVVPTHAQVSLHMTWTLQFAEAALNAPRRDS